MSRETKVIEAKYRKAVNAADKAYERAVGKAEAERAKALGKAESRKSRASRLDPDGEAARKAGKIFSQEVSEAEKAYEEKYTGRSSFGKNRKKPRRRSMMPRSRSATGNTRSSSWR